MRNILLLCILALSLSSYAQTLNDLQTSDKSQFNFNKMKENACLNEDVTISMPKGFIECPSSSWDPFLSNIEYSNKVNYKTKGNGLGGFPYQARLQSKNKECIILYPIFTYGAPRFEGQIQEDIAYAAENELLDIRPFVKIIDKKDGIYISNADKAVIYEFKTPDKRFGMYDNFVGIYLRKQGHGCLVLKIGLTDEGLKHKDKYIKMLLNSIKYGDKILNPNDKQPSDNEFRFEPPTQLRPVANPGYIQ